MILNFNFDKDTEIILYLISKYLKKYFEYETDDIPLAINNFYSKMKSMVNEKSERDFIDLNFHHDHPFLVSCRIHFHNSSRLQKEFENAIEWLNAIGWFEVPEEAIKDSKVWIDEKGYYT